MDHARRLTEPEAFKRAVAALTEAREVFCYGVAASEPGARHLSLALGRIGRRSRFVSETGFALADQLLALGQGDIVVIFQPGHAARGAHGHDGTRPRGRCQGRPGDG